MKQVSVSGWTWVGSSPKAPRTLSIRSASARCRRPQASAPRSLMPSNVQGPARKARARLRAMRWLASMRKSAGCPNRSREARRVVRWRAQSVARCPLVMKSLPRGSPEETIALLESRSIVVLGHARRRCMVKRRGHVVKVGRLRLLCGIAPGLEEMQQGLQLLSGFRRHLEDLHTGPDRQDTLTGRDIVKLHGRGKVHLGDDGDIGGIEDRWIFEGLILSFRHRKEHQTQVLPQ